MTGDEEFCHGRFCSVNTADHCSQVISCWTVDPRMESYCGQNCSSRQPLQLYCTGHRLHTLIAMPRLTQPSTLHTTVKRVSAFEQSDNKRQCWVQMVEAYRHPWWMAWYEGRWTGHLVHSLNDMNCALSQWLCHDDSSTAIILITILRLLR